jgi:hypothetical protein
LLGIFGWEQKTVFGLELHVGAASFVGVFLPLVAVLMVASAFTDARVLAIVAVPLAIAALLWWYFAWHGELFMAGRTWLTQALTGSALAGTLLGLLVRKGRTMLLWLLPVLAAGAALGWLLDGNSQAFLMGAGHGLLLGLLSRVVAWSLDREQAACSLGAFVGACGGAVLADLYTAPLAKLLLDPGFVGAWRTSLSLYAEVGVAYLGAVAVGLVLGKRARHGARLKI